MTVSTARTKIFEPDHQVSVQSGYSSARVAVAAQKLKATRNLFGKPRAAPSHHSRYEVAITVLTPAIAK